MKGPDPPDVFGLHEIHRREYTEEHEIYQGEDGKSAVKEVQGRKSNRVCQHGCPYGMTPREGDQEIAPARYFLSHALNQKSDDEQHKDAKSEGLRKAL